MTINKERKITNKKGKRVKVPLFLPKGPRPKGGWSDTTIKTAERKREDWVTKNQTEVGKKISEAMKKSWKEGRPPAGANVPKSKTSLKFLLDIQSNRTSGWTIEKATQLVECIQTQMADDTYGGYKFDCKKATKATGMSQSSVTFFMSELKKANAEGYSLEQYFRLGRPFKQGNKVLA